jgi:hypothetical protein
MGYFLRRLHVSLKSCGAAIYLGYVAVRTPFPITNPAARKPSPGATASFARWRLIAATFLRAAAVVVFGRREREVTSQLFDLMRDRVIILHNPVPDPVLDVARAPHRGELCMCCFWATSVPERACLSSRTPLPTYH